MKSIDEQQQTTLQNYLSNMSDLLLKENLLGSKPEDVVRQVAEAQTLTAIRNLDPARKGILVNFLYESSLIIYNPTGKTHPIITFNISAELGGAYLFGAYLYDADLSGADLYDANLNSSFLVGANLSDANFYNADLGRAELVGANLSDADFYNADLSGANLEKALQLHLLPQQ